ncbi:MAG: phosphoribosylformylglycinamidine synthase subunit PurS [Candidatus Adiutrix sp.]|jgi:phosphoribosylformylglycinamidine synthase|nr:phosphoribosylformylglycinamidine synthase subunit PurS [Candidatus Adiutrix sp.]
MKKFTVKVTVMLKKSVLDPQGAAVERALKAHGHHEPVSVRIGKVIELTLNGENAAAAEKKAAEWADSFLANPVMETFALSVEESE